MKSQEKKSIDASCLILGFTGSLGSGCTFLSEGITKILSDHGHYYRLSEVLNKIAEERGLEQTVSNLQDIGNELRGKVQSDGKPNLSFLIAACLQNIETDIEKSDFTEDENAVILIDSIKNEGEVKYLKQFPNFYLISVQADRDVRSSRLVGPTATKHRFNTNEEFLIADKRDEEEDIPNGQQIKRCNYLADIIVNNNEVQESDRKKREFFNKFIEGYIQPMRKVRRGETPHDRPPKIEETLMTLAYCVSKRSSCLKRKVGAVIAYVRNFKGEEQPEDRDLQFQIVSTGYNDVPAGKPCVFSDWGKCYRDCLQEEHAKKF
jgi:deoxycytidylate deaminase